MSLSSVLKPLLNKAVLNPGKPYRVTLERGLEVSFKLRMTGDVVMQLSRLKPSKPSHQELSICLNNIYLKNPTAYTYIISEMKELEDENRNYSQVFFSPPGGD